MRKFAKFFAASLALAAAFGAAPAHAFWEFDGGGQVADYLDLVASANATGARVEIGGVCASACTMKLGARGACVHADAQLWFHAARFEDGGLNPLGTRILLRQYPERIRSWALNSGALTSLQFTAMSGEQAIAYGVADCDRPNPVAINYTPRPAAAAGCEGLVSIWTGCASAPNASYASPVAASFRYGRTAF